MYSPKIDEELIPALYRLAKEQKIPMTRLVNGMLRSAIEKDQSDPPAAVCQVKGTSSISESRPESDRSSGPPLARAGSGISVVRI